MWLILGVVVLALPSEDPSLTVAPPMLVAVSTLGLTAYHAISYRRDFINSPEYERKGPVTVLVDPFKRVFVLITTVVLSGAVVRVVGSPVGVIGVLVAAKTVFDIQAHRREHQFSSVKTETSIQ